MIFSFISDKYNFFGMGWRRPYCLIGLLITAGCFLLLTTFSPADYFPLYVFVMVTRNCAIALADGATEGLSVDAGIEESSGAVQAWMVRATRATHALVDFCASHDALLVTRRVWDVVRIQLPAMPALLPLPSRADGGPHAGHDGRLRGGRPHRGAVVPVVHGLPGRHDRGVRAHQLLHQGA